jgi:hypothetical protein
MLKYCHLIKLKNNNSSFTANIEFNRTVFCKKNILIDKEIRISDKAWHKLSGFDN